MKRINNVFISSGSNILKLVDIVYDEKIREIIIKSGHNINWEDISDSEKRIEYIKQFSSENTLPGIIEGGYNLLIPGAIDAHVHFNTPGFEEREDFEHGSNAAAIGGVTTVIDMPCTSIPPVTSTDNMGKKLRALSGRSIVDYAFWGGVSGNDFEVNIDIAKQVLDLKSAGVVGYKTYLISGMNTFRELSESRLMETARIIKSIDGILAVHAEEKNLVQKRTDKFIQEGRNNWQAYCEARDVNAEVNSVSKIIEISGKTGCRMHIVHLSSAEAVSLIREAQKNGIYVTTETCPHYLYFTQDDFDNPSISNFLKTAPPVKTKEDREALWEGIKDGTVYFVTTDHAGCDPTKEKISDNFWEIYGGIPGIEHRVEFLFSEGLHKRNLPISKIIDLLSSNVADYFRLDNKGKLEVGKDSDMVIINLWKRKKINSALMHSKGKYTPFNGIEFDCSVEKTILRGEIIMSDGFVAEEKMGYGKFIKTVYAK